MAPELTTNFATSLVATAPSPATSGTSLVVTAGHGSRFPDPAVANFNAVVCPSDAQPSPANAEVVRVTAKSTDTFTITRATESSSARSIVVGDRIFAGVTAKTLADLDTALAGKQPLDADLTAIAALTSAADKLPYATGSGAWALADLSSAGRALIDDAAVSNQRTTLDVYSTAQVDGAVATLTALVTATRTATFALPILENAATQTTSAYSNNLAGWTLADAATPVLSAQGTFPNDVTTGNFTVRLLIGAPTVAASPNDVVRLGVSYKTIGNAGTISGALTGITTADFALTANQLKYADFASGAQPVAGNFIAIRVFREGTHANDTLAANAFLHGIVVVYTAKL